MIINNHQNINGVANHDLNDYLSVGRRPANGSLINVYGSATNGFTLFYTVPASKVFHLTDFIVSWNATGAASVYLGAHDGVPALQYKYFTIGTVAAQYGSLPMNFASADEIPATWRIYVYSSNALATIYAYIHGWEVPA